MSRTTKNVTLEEAAQVLEGAEDLIVAAHRHPDGDAIGSMLGLGLGLLRLGKAVRFLSTDGVPPSLRSLPGADRVSTSTDRGAELAVALDTGSWELLGDVERTFHESATVLRIDHHGDGKTFGDLSYVDPSAAAVGEQVFGLLAALKVDLDRDIASCLMASILVDTGSFRFSNVTAKTFAVCHRLLSTGVDYAELADTVYWQRTRASLHLAGLLYSRLSYLAEGKVSWSYITAEDFNRAGGTPEDLDVVANDLRGIEGVLAGVLFRELPNGEWRVSLRSRHCVNVAAVAKRFNGGGHEAAAGCRLPNFESAREELLSAVVHAVTSTPGRQESCG